MSDAPEIVWEAHSADGQRKIQVFRRPDGTYGFEGYRFSDELRESCWIPYGYHGCRAVDAHSAIREALGRVDWAQQLDGMTVNERLADLGLRSEYEAAVASKDLVKIEQILVRARLDRASIDAILNSLG